MILLPHVIGDEEVDGDAVLNYAVLVVLSCTFSVFVGAMSLQYHVWLSKVQSSELAVFMSHMRLFFSIYRTSQESYDAFLRDIRPLNIMVVRLLCTVYPLYQIVESTVWQIERTNTDYPLLYWIVAIFMGSPVLLMWTLGRKLLTSRTESGIAGSDIG